MSGIVAFVRFFDTAVKFLVSWSGRFATLLLAILATVMFLGVVFRLVLNMPFSWTDEFAKYCMVWITFLGAPVVMLRASHVTVDILHQYLPKMVCFLLRLAIAIFCALLLVLFVRYGWPAAVSAKRHTIVIMNNITMFWVYVSVPVGSVIFLLVQIATIMKMLLVLCDRNLEETFFPREK